MYFDKQAINTTGIVCQGLLIYQMHEKGKDIFDVHLNKDGADWILRFCKVVQWILLINILVGITHITHNILRIAHINLKLYDQKPALRFEYLWFPFFWLFYDTLLLVQLYVFWQFRCAMKKAVSNLDQTEFNISFSYLLKMTKLSVVLSIMGLGSALFALFLHVKYFS
jgi:hypothetical protein